MRSSTLNPNPSTQMNADSFRAAAKRKADGGHLRKRARFVAPKKSLTWQAKTSKPEHKLIDTAVAGYVCDTTGTVTLMNGVAQGTDYTNRVGRKFVNLTVQLEGSIQPLDVTTGPTKCRVMVIYDKQPNGALPAITDVLSASTSNAFMNLNNRDRFIVIANINETIGGVSNVATQSYAQSPNVVNVSLYKAIKMETINDGTGATVGDIQSGSIFLLTVGDQAPGAGGAFVGALRVRFDDQ